MTISLIHFNPDTGLAASVTATGGVAVGGYVNHSWRGLGACATQGLYTNPWYAEKAKAYLAQGLSAKEVIEHLKKDDSDYAKRQCAIVDEHGNAAFINGDENIAHVESLAVPHLAVAGNMLENSTVITAFADTFLQLTTTNPTQVKTGEKPKYQEGYEQRLPEILIDSLEQALEAGGDKRGTYSASLRVESFSKAPIDIRVDWANNNLIEHMRKVLSHVKEEGFQTFLKHLPNH
ncbi:DUF1028 domain-containing protein [Photobacterium sanctipauli]|uniref:DUF1028 domain-containing protein n=1 Tax=Photobacterium sanctipauli TaxID=1342794 RepID=A0A2T3NZR3_9GAMM|nr:DUF1028 domain-containing protein [Photobacterium sanctipauli]PSW21755.1 DUF1028 domain-containing protein [Photobacterium sanctipauli]